MTDKVIEDLMNKVTRSLEQAMGGICLSPDNAERIMMTMLEDMFDTRTMNLDDLTCAPCLTESKNGKLSHSDESCHAPCLTESKKE